MIKRHLACRGGAYCLEVVFLLSYTMPYMGGVCIWAEMHKGPDTAAGVRALVGV